MELSERCIQTLEKEGFTSIYEESLQPGETTSLPIGVHNTALFLTEGTATVTVAGVVKEMLPGDRVDSTPGAGAVFVSGDNGCQYVVGV